MASCANLLFDGDDVAAAYRMSKPAMPPATLVMPVTNPLKGPRNLDIVCRVARRRSLGAYQAGSRAAREGEA